MDLQFDIKIAQSYKSKSQIARVLTENWVDTNSFCPNCGNAYLKQFDNNKPVADFYCKSCSEQYELKSKNGIKVGNKIVDGAYSKMIDRINSKENPNFFFLTYDNSVWQVINFIVIPKYFFISDIIEERKPLSSIARRSGWKGCNINLSSIPESGKIFIVKDSLIISEEKVLSQWKRTNFIREAKGNAKGWLLDIWNCIDLINNDNFTLKDVYKFEDMLKTKHSNNGFIKDKIRQVLQKLRDNGIIEFKGRGTYKKIR